MGAKELVIADAVYLSLFTVLNSSFYKNTVFSELLFARKIQCNYIMLHLFNEMLLYENRNLNVFV